MKKSCLLGEVILNQCHEGTPPAFSVLDFHTTPEDSLSKSQGLSSQSWVLTIFWSSSADSWTRSRSLLSTTKMRPWVGRKKEGRRDHSYLSPTLTWPSLPSPILSCISLSHLVNF